ncbi:hypothetical protein [Mycobacterium alsense]|uniref:hypothetical protein n=1 Tax=Mycobacterium alsense TaxID=324058 RepID=UPI000A57A67B|nr:hypothetical protein [Mycobacterium alsense]
MKYYAAELGPAVRGIGKLIALLIRGFGQNGLIAAGCVLLVFAVVAGAVWYVRRTRSEDGEGAPPPTAFHEPPEETRPVSQAKAGDGYFKKCAACGKFTRNAKVCRNCGQILTDNVHPS